MVFWGVICLKKKQNLFCGGPRCLALCFSEGNAASAQVNVRFRAGIPDLVVWGTQGRKGDSEGVEVEGGFEREDIHVCLFFYYFFSC